MSDQINMDDENSDKKTPGIKQFIDYLNQTVKIFGDYYSDEEFERKDSDIYKLFITLFYLYAKIGSHANENQCCQKIKKVQKMMDNHIKTKKAFFKWENSRYQDTVSPLKKIDPSEKIVRDLYKKKLIETKTTIDNGPILFTDEKLIKNIGKPIPTDKVFIERWDSIDSDISNKKNDGKINADNVSKCESEFTNKPSYQNTDEIDYKIINLKKLLN